MTCSRYKKVFFFSQKILKWKFRAKGIEPKQFVLYGVLGLPRTLDNWTIGLDRFSQDTHENLWKVSKAVG